MAIVARIEVDRCEDSYTALWVSADGRVGFSGGDSQTMVGALAQLCAVIIKIDEDDLRAQLAEARARLE